MQIKIKGRNKSHFENTLTCVMNMVCIICMQGYMPSIPQMNNPLTGRCWRKEESNNRFDLYPMTNNYWANIIEEGENYIILEFNIRYDSKNKKATSLTNLILYWMSEDEVELITE